MVEQKMAKIAMELTCRTAIATWHLAYASDKGILRTELEWVKTQLNEVTTVHSYCEQKHKEAEKVIAEGRVILWDRETNLADASLSPLAIYTAFLWSG